MMDILNQNSNSVSFNPSENAALEKEIIINGNKDNENIFRLNPLLNESLNNLVKRLERTKIPKPPPTKGQSIRKKSKLSNSLPNMFLPPGFDDHKLSNNEKKVQWTNKLNLNLEKLKDAFSDTYNFWCNHKRSLSISRLEKGSMENIQVNISENFNNDTGQKNMCDNELLTQRVLPKFGIWNASNIDKIDHQSKVTAGDNHETSELEDIPSFSTHVYLDGAIIEPISPASPACIVDPPMTTTIENIINKEEEKPLLEREPDEIIKPVVRKKGRPKKIQNDLKLSKPAEMSSQSHEREPGRNTNIDKLSSKVAKHTPKKKQKKTAKITNKNKTFADFSSDGTNDTLGNTVVIQLPETPEKSASTKKQKPLSKQIESSKLNNQGVVLSIESIITADNYETIENSKSEKHSLIKNSKNLPRQSRSTKTKNQNIDFSDEPCKTVESVDLSIVNTQKDSPTKKLRRTSKLPVASNEKSEIHEDLDISSNNIEESSEKAISTKPYVELSNQTEKIQDDNKCPKLTAESDLYEGDKNDSTEMFIDSKLLEKVDNQILTKKQIKSSKQGKTNRKNTSSALEPDFGINDIEEYETEKVTLTKKQKQLLKKQSPIDKEDDSNVKPDLTDVPKVDLYDVAVILNLSDKSKFATNTNKDLNINKDLNEDNQNFNKEMLITGPRTSSKQNKVSEENPENVSCSKLSEIPNDNMVYEISVSGKIFPLENPDASTADNEKTIEEKGQIITSIKGLEFSIEAQLNNTVETVRDNSIPTKKDDIAVINVLSKTPRKLSKQKKSDDVIREDECQKNLSEKSDDVIHEDVCQQNMSEKAADAIHVDQCHQNMSEAVRHFSGSNIEKESATKLEVTINKLGDSDKSLVLNVLGQDIGSIISVKKSEKSDEKSVVSKPKKRGPKPGRKGKLNQDHTDLNESDTTVKGTRESIDEDPIPVDKRRRLQRGHHSPKLSILSQNVEVLEVPLKNFLNDSPKRVAKVKPGPKCKKQFFKSNEPVLQNDTIEEASDECIKAENLKISSKIHQKGRLKEIISEEINMSFESRDLSAEDSFKERSLSISVDKIEDVALVFPCDMASDHDLLKRDFHEITEQSNDIEILSNSITDSVHTSMLPPRKRYKRLMYLDDHTKALSPKQVDNIENTEGLGVCQVASHDNEPTGEETPTKKFTNIRSKLKRKKQIKTVEDFALDIPSEIVIAEASVVVEEIKDEVIHNKEDQALLPILTEEIIDKPSSLKRSKREAAARGFANMVAMSLNNSSQSHENSSDFQKKAKVDSADDVSTDISNSKLFKRPKKSTLSNIGSLKNKGKLSKSFDFMDEVDDDVEDVEVPKILTKKQKMSREKNNSLKENPPSPGETVISTDSSIQDTVKYKKIRTNLYTDPKPTHWFQEVERCGCKPSSLKHLYDDHEKHKKNKSRKWTSDIVWDCTDNCLNRLTYTECSSKICPCGDNCNNQKIKKLDFATGLKITDVQSKGRGVITTKLIPEGSLITEYVGEVISERTFQERMINLYKEDIHHYCLHLDGDMLIDAYRCGSVARFVNHSCQPNCEMQKWFVNGAYRMCLFANEDIDPDTELTYDYNFCSFNTKTTQLCLCGAPNCRGFIGGRPRAEQSESQKDRKRLFFAFGRTLSTREKLFVLRHSIFLVRGRILGRCRRLGIRRTKQTHGIKLPSTITEIKRRKTKKNQFLTQMSALNSIRSIRTRLLMNAQENQHLTRTAQLAQVLRDLYNTLLEQKDPMNPCQQLVAPFIKGLKPKKYPEFYNMVGHDAIVSLNQVYMRLLDGKYMTMMSFDQDILQMIQNIEIYAGKQSNIGKCAEQIKLVYKDLKMNSIALYEALTDEMIDERDKAKLLSNNLAQVSNAVKSLSSSTVDSEQNESNSQPKNKKRKQGPAANVGGSRGRLERGAEVIKCVCGFLIEAGHVMVQCDRCFVWQHAYCMNVARSSELVDVTRMEPYYCHVCLNIPTESLVREIPRHFVITDETIDSGNTLFWTLLHKDSSLLKIDDFVYIPSEDETNSLSMKSDEVMDLSKRTIMRIYSLWKDANGQRWMEGGLFLRPYHSYLRLLTESRTNSSEVTNKRKASTTMNLNTHKWHQQEVVYTDLTKILSLDVCIGRCHVLNNHTFRLGKPMLQNVSSNSIDDVYLCDWLINKAGDWSEIDPAYMKINMKSYCFERFTDASNSETNSNGTEKFLRQFTTEELLKFDQGPIEPCQNKSIKVKTELSKEEMKLLRNQQFEKLITKLSEFSQDHSRKLPLSPPSSIGSLSSPPSRDASPLCENSGSKSPTPNHDVVSFPHHQRKPMNPKRILNEAATAPIASEYSESSPKLMIVVEEDRVTKIADKKLQEDETSTTDEKSSEQASCSPKENSEDRSHPCSEIKYGDLLDLLKETNVKSSTIKSGYRPKPKSKRTKVPNQKLLAKPKKKEKPKKNILKPVSEINSVDDNWEPIQTVPINVASRRETRSRRCQNDPQDEKKLFDETESNLDLDDDDDSRKTCFVKLERIRVSKTEKNRLKKMEKVQMKEENIKPKPTGEENKADASLMCGNVLKPEDSLKQSASNENVTCIEDNTSSVACNNRSKRKKGVPKRIPFDFTFQSISSSNVTKSEESGTILPYDYEVVDLSSGKSSHTDKPDQTTVDCQQIESPELVVVPILSQKLPKPNQTATEARNDFSSIENISSN